MGKGKKPSKTEFVFFPPPGFFGRKFNLPSENSKGKRRMLLPKTRQESYEAINRREEIDYEKLPKARLIVVKDRFVNFFRHFKYLGSWISFYLREDHDIVKRIAAENVSIGDITKIWNDDKVDTYLRYLLFRFIPCNLLLWGYKSWALRKSLLASLKVFLHRGIRITLEVKMCQVF